jgi:parvulin-like peptidyl-prolyl isomerase
LANQYQEKDDTITAESALYCDEDLKKKKNGYNIIITVVVPVIIFVLFWITAAYPFIIEQEIAFNTDNTISIQGSFDTKNIYLYDSKNKTVMYTAGADYIITQQTQEVIIQRLEGGIIPPRGLVFVYINGKDKGDASKDQSDKTNIVAEINAESLTDEELLKQYNLFFAISGYSEDYRQQIRIESYLDQHIFKILLLQDASKIGIAAAGLDEVDQYKEIYLSETGQTEDTLSSNLRKSGLSIEDADRFFEKNLIIKLLIDKKFGDIEISDEEAREFYNSKPEYFDIHDRVTASHILICHNESLGCHSNLTRQEAKELAEHVRTLATPENFADLARQYSMDTTAPDGGDLGYIYKGMAVPTFEDAVFNLGVGDISDIVETDFGYHIIYVTDKKEAHVTTFEEARESIKKSLKVERIQSELRTYSAELRTKADIKIYAIKSNKAPVPVEAEAQESAVIGNTGSSDMEFQTFKNTGEDICTNDRGLPLIILSTASGCSHCIWVGDTFESTVMEYVDKGLIEAHHYEIYSKDDFLTAAVEIEIPQSHLEIFQRRNPEGDVPYFNFGCKYERIGTGYEYQDDLPGEAKEFRQVINSLLIK